MLKKKRWNYSEKRRWACRASKRNRRKMTQSELLFCVLAQQNNWKIKFKVQAPFIIGENIYIADFYIPEHKLIIEFDGGYHASRREKDKERDAELLKKGKRVIRFENRMLWEAPDSVFKTIEGAMLQ